jgi:hypothetical protein
MNLGRQDIAGIVGLTFLFVVGGWSAIDPESWIRYFLKNRIESSPNQAGVRSLVRFIGICLVILSAFGIAATLKTR